MTGKLAKERAAAHRARRNENRAIERETELRNRLKLVSVQRDELLKVAQGILAEDMLQYLPAEYVANVRAAIASAKGGAAC